MERRTWRRPLSSCAALLKRHLYLTMQDGPTSLQSAVGAYRAERYPSNARRNTKVRHEDLEGYLEAQR